jgi:glutathione S-transferase
MYQLYYAPNSCSLASHIALETAGAEYEAISVNLARNEQRDDKYLSLNPKGRVPVLVTGDGILTENPAILVYISQMFPAAELAPPVGSFAFAQALSFNAYLSSTVHVAHAHGARGTRWADDPIAIEDMKRKMPGVMTDCFEMIETRMFKGPWVLGDQYSICDAYLFTIATWLENDRVDPAQFPRVYEHRSRMQANPVIQRVIAAQ